MTKTMIRAHLNPTESPEKVERAITRLFGDIEIKHIKNHEMDHLEATLDGIDALKTLRSHLAQERIRDSVRAMLTRWASDSDKVTFHLNRQAAYAGHVSIYHANKVPMGPIEVGIEGDPQEIIDYLCGKTRSDKVHKK